MCRKVHVNEDADVGMTEVEETNVKKVVTLCRCHFFVGVVRNFVHTRHMPVLRCTREKAQTEKSNQ